ncbi:hypothetical protein BOS5A_200711 [Bosea sp. EC-HK365B]|nr:hypothetical protein BOSE46_120434 [Bosea sp. 46]CAD5262289.1 hypothetical protein BOSE21B_110662 [Bosea sp. 21B]CAD5278193.1 hypothetical protein BOSE7B_40555 [Bosea sp. 7B]VVT58689.1 hypothetical protein BOS5A_200711 [Bosea sp. EC-HK365B]VXB58764.1 hypothetical protein BOSE29B_110598 [Bosea sp. 29B]VXB99806.1 hypothetical protein BOSE125_160390 [Bosea sp. 125]VXC80597.1 hypothetical protein BOSE127_50263 [Bosea sp. 127]
MKIVASSSTHSLDLINKQFAESFARLKLEK